MVKGCVKTLLVLAACVALSYVAIRGRVPEPRDLWAAVAVGTALWLGWGCFETAAEGRKSEAALSGTLVGRAPADGERAVAAGEIRAISSPLTAPFSGKPCVLYEYSIFRYGGSSSDEDRTTLAAGFALTPSEVRTPSGPMKLLGFPLGVKLEKHVRVGREERDRAAAYLASTSFEGAGLARIGKMVSSVKDLMADDDGAVRKDFRMTEGVTDLSGYTLEERLLPEGEPVTIAGKYVAAKGGITGDMGRAMPLTLELGGVDVALAKLAKDTRSRIVSGIVMIVLILLTTFGVLEYLERQEGRSLLPIPATSR